MGMAELVTILGGGNGAHAAAADMARRGFEVRMFEDEKFAGKMQKVFETKEIAQHGVLGEGVGKLSMVTTDIAEAVKGVKYIIMAVPAFGHSYYADLLIDHLEDGQIILILAGTFGSLIFWNKMKEREIKKDVVFAETYTLPYDTRLMGPGESMVMGIHEPVKTGVMPAKKTVEVLKELKKFYDVEAAESVIESGVFTLNPVVHVPGCIMNAERIELMEGEFWFSKEGITPCVGKVTEALDEERMEIIKKFGYKAVSVVDSLAAAGSVKTNIYEAITGNEQFGKIKGPDGLKNRYYTEDIPFGLVGWSVIAELIGVKTPVMDYLITIGSIAMEQDCRATGRKAKELGIAGMNLEQIKTYLYEG